MLARASADVRLRPGDLIGRDGRRRLPARGPGGDARPVPRARRRGRAPDRAARASCGRRSWRGPMTRRPGERRAARSPVASRRCPPASTRRASSSTSTRRARTSPGMAEGAAGRAGSPLRPHAKTHKSVALARLQLDRGRRRDHGRDARRGRGLGRRRDRRRLRRPTRSGPTARRPNASARSTSGASLTVGVDSAGGGRAPRARRRRDAAGPLRVLVEIDSGRPPERASPDPRRPSTVARARAATPGLDVDRRLHPRRPRLPGAGAGPARPPTRSRTLGAAADALARRASRSSAISAGSTPTGVHAAAGQVNEIRRRDVRPRRPPAVRPRRDPGRRDRPRGRRDGRLDGRRRPGRPRRRRQDPDEGPGGVPRRASASSPAYPDAVIERLFDYHAAVDDPSRTRGARGSARSSRSSPTTSARSSSSSTSSSSRGTGRRSAAGRSTRGGGAGERRVRPDRADDGRRRRGRPQDLRRGDRDRHRDVRHGRARLAPLGRDPPAASAGSSRAATARSSAGPRCRTTRPGTSTPASPGRACTSRTRPAGGASARPCCATLIPLSEAAGIWTLHRRHPDRERGQPRASTSGPASAGSASRSGSAGTATAAGATSCCSSGEAGSSASEGRRQEA